VVSHRFIPFLGDARPGGASGQAALLSELELLATAAIVAALGYAGFRAAEHLLAILHFTY